jgi:hypothetical protein
VCGACGSGGGVPSWEDRLTPPSRGALLSRVAVSNRLLGRGLQVRSWQSGYLLGNGRGRSAHAADLDQLWRTCGQWGAQVCGWSARAGVEEVPLEADVVGDLNLVAVWAAAVAHAGGPATPLRLELPDPARERSLRVEISPGTVAVQVLHGAGSTARLCGVGARSAAEHLGRSVARAD